ncbi:hypothetical protein Clacol_005175 [Clathrus columnatus]|uniref:Uncharacterized protein n=1 Tax=Clathrus columnatus TaxID=1419009 RepID=A0AAV5AD66_9AGAM|nr:hypothetical protein Clacol_005175 [Clathrus columnatus]
MTNSDIPTSPTLIFNADFPDFYVSVNSGKDDGHLYVWNYILSAVSQVWTLRKEGNGYRFLSTVVKDSNGNLLSDPKTVHVVANHIDGTGPLIGGTLRASSEFIPVGTTGALIFRMHYVPSLEAFQIFTRRERTYLFLTLESEGNGVWLKLNESSNQPRQLWKFKPTAPGLRLGPGQTSI